MTLDAQLRQRRQAEQAAADLPPPLPFRPRPQRSPGQALAVAALTLLALAGWALFFLVLSVRFVIVGV